MPKCRICKQPFKKLSIIHKDCSPSCAIEGLKLDKEKRARKEYLSEKKRLKPRREWLKDVQTTFNAYIRKRDELLPCISCQRHHTGQYHAGHYLTVGARPELRFNEFNVSKQCSACNNHLSGNIALYRVNLIKKIGLERVEWLEGPHEPKKYSIPELIELQQWYKDKIKKMV